MPDIRVVQTHRIIDPTAELHDVYPALVITDLEMPEMTDLEVSSEWIRTLSNVKVIAMSDTPQSRGRKNKAA